MTSKVWIDKTGNTLRLRWNYEGRKQALSLGVRDDVIGRALARSKGAEIEKDLAAGYYDPTLLKYKPRILGANPTEITAVELFEKYIKHRCKEDLLSHSSIGRLKAIASKLKQLLGDKLAEKVTVSVAKDAIARWSESASSSSIKTYLDYLKACWNWAKGKYHTTDSNPWAECLNRALSRGNTGAPKQPIKPFTISELQAIIEGFANDPYYCHYTDFVTFLANTGCRTGEAVGLKWESLGDNYATAWIGASISRGHQNRNGTKTGKFRTIQLPPSVRSMLKDRFDRLNPPPDELVFLSPKGLPIDDHNFNRRAWKSVLAKCQIEYRSPYKLRHSQTSHALAGGANPIALAEQLGHDKRTMLSTYAHAIELRCVLVDIGKA